MKQTVDFHSANALFAKYQINLTQDNYDKLAKYADLMISELQYQNITAVRDIQEIWVRHFLDSAILCKFFPEKAFSVIDIGTGGGIPGIPIAILCPHANITLLDSELRKIEFCQKVVSEIGLSVSCVSARAEELARNESYREHYDFAVSRAMTTGTVLSELSLPFLKVNGQLVAMKGKNYDPAVERFDESAAVLNARVETLLDYQIENEPKKLIFVLKTDHTPDIYPRRFAKIKRQPL